MTTRQSLREKRKEKKRKEGNKTKLIWGSVIAIVLALLAYVAWTNVRPPEGQEFAIMDAQHVNEGSPLPEYNSNPPTSGGHYSRGLNRGFYDLDDLANISGEPVGHLVHNLEHGYIVIWYNCDQLSDSACESLMEELEDYLGGSLVAKQIAFPWSGTEHPVVLTSWGRMLEMDEFDRGQARAFTNANRLLAPEPNAP